MKFLIDESVEKPIVDWLRDQKYDVMYVAESSSGITDEEVIKLANCESRILITNDKDFGELIFRQGRITQGILLNASHKNVFELIVKSINWQIIVTLLGSFSLSPMSFPWKWESLKTKY